MVSSGPGKSGGRFLRPGSGLVPSNLARGGTRGWKTNHGSRGRRCALRSVCRCTGTEQWQKKRGVALVSADTPGCPRFRRHRRTSHAPRPPGALRICNCSATNCKSRFSVVNTNACVHACPPPPNVCTKLSILDGDLSRGRRFGEKRNNRDSRV